MDNYFLAIDIGASSGRHILGNKAGEKLLMKEIYRFENGMVQRGGHLCWNLDVLFNHIKEGLKKSRAEGITPVSVGIDTWGCDFVLLDENKKLLGDFVAYRDSRTNGVPEKVASIISDSELYEATGLQKLPFNTIYQLMAVKEQQPELLQKAAHFLTVPDYFNFLLTGEITNEYTCASTTELVNVDSMDWDYALIEKLGLPSRIFKPVTKPGTVIGWLLPEIASEVGFNCDVVAPCTHDTGSAVAALPVCSANCGNAPQANSAPKSMDVYQANDASQSGKVAPLYISSGTWSLLGTELTTPEKSEKARLLNYTHEGGYNGRYRFLKNIMGLWMIQSIRKELMEKEGRKIGFDELDKEAEKADIDSVVDCNSSVFLAPSSMIDAVREECRKNGSKVPETAGELAAVVYDSLAACYAKAVNQLCEIFGKKFTDLYIIGGGSKSVLLNKKTAEKTGLTVHTGPVEATAAGNLVVQMITAGEFASLDDARRCISVSGL